MCNSGARDNSQAGVRLFFVVDRVITDHAALTPHDHRHSPTDLDARGLEVVDLIFTRYRPTRPDGHPGADCEVLTWLDDCSRDALSVTAHHRVTGAARRVFANTYPHDCGSVTA